MKKILIVTLVVIFQIALISFVNADMNTYYWHSDPTYYCSSLTTDMYTATNYGIGEWNDALDQISSTIDINLGSSSNRDILVVDYDYGATGWAGQCTTTHTTTDISFAYVKYNEYYFTGYSYMKKLALASHELGHVVGQSHTLINVDSIMLPAINDYYDRDNVYNPTNYDISCLNYRY